MSRSGYTKFPERVKGDKFCVRHSPSGRSGSSSRGAALASAMRRLLSWGCLVAVILGIAFFRPGRSVSAHLEIEAPPSAGDPLEPAWPVQLCNGKELIKQSDEKLTLGNVPSPYTPEWPNTIAICAIMKDESAQDVQEFLEYHRWIGVDTFYMRENGEECAVRDVLEPYERAGVLDFDLAPGPKYPLQTNWYNECSKLASKKHSWVAFIDLDEFIVVLNKQQSVTRQGALKEVLRRSFRYNAAVSMQWVLFGSGGHKAPPPEGQLQGFRRCTGDLTRQMKCLGSSYWFHNVATFRPTHVHQCNFRCGAIAAMGNSEPVEMRRVPMRGGAQGPFGLSYAAHLPPEAHVAYQNLTDEYQIVLNHYVTRSQDKFIERKIKLSGTGKYAETFNALRSNTTGLTDDELYSKFEELFGLSGEHEVCSQASDVAAAMRAVQDAGDWSPVPTTPGLLIEGAVRRIVTVRYENSG
eukprot:jgi/Ulvmu1/11819/UM080_0030.1